jgi:MFS family permease
VNLYARARICYDAGMSSSTRKASENGAAVAAASAPSDPHYERRWLILLGATVVNVALPSAQHDLGFSNATRQWVITAYTLPFGSLPRSADGWPTCSAASACS